MKEEPKFDIEKYAEGNEDYFKHMDEH